MGRHVEAPTPLFAERTRSQRLRVAPKKNALIFENLMATKVAHQDAKWRFRASHPGTIGAPRANARNDAESAEPNTGPPEKWE